MKTNTVIIAGKWLICLFLCCCVVPVSAQQASLQKRVDKLLDNEFFQKATTGIYVYDLTDQRDLYQHNEKRLCRPASNMKLLTSATAITFLTPTYEFKTKLFHTGIVDESEKLQGDLYLAGGFDPEMSSADLDTMILWLKKSGINSMEGNLYLDVTMADSIYWGKAWSWDDDLEAFQPYLSPMPLNKSVVKLKVIPASPNRAPIIKMEPESSFIRVENRASTVWKSSELPQKSLRFYRDCNGKYNRIIVSGTIAASAQPYEKMVSLKNPNRYALTLLSEKIMTQMPGSTIDGIGLAEVPTDAWEVGYTKRSLVEAVRKLNKDSDNLNAEMFLYALGHQSGDKPSTTEKGIAIVQQMISQLGLNPKTYSIVDGSGLSNQDYLTPELLVNLLIYMYKSPDFALFKESLPISGVDGTLAHRMKGTSAYRKISAKTGSITGVCTLSGYATASNGHLLAFSIMIQNFVEKTSYVANQYIDKICEILTE